MESVMVLQVCGTIAFVGVVAGALAAIGILADLSILPQRTSPSSPAASSAPVAVSAVRDSPSTFRPPETFLVESPLGPYSVTIPGRE